MSKNILIIAKKEFKSLIKSWITILSTIIFLIGPIYVYSPIEDKHIWKVSQAAYQCNNGIVMVAVFIIPIVVISLYYKDTTTEMPLIMFSQPITAKIYCIGKFLGAYIYCLFFSFIENIIWVFIPLYFKATIYSPVPFLKYFLIYSVPSFLAIVAFAYFFEVVFNIKPLTMFLPILLIMVGDGKVASRFSVNISYIYMGNLYVGEALTHEAINIIIMNRIFIILAAAVFTVISILNFSPQKLMNRR